MRNWFVLTLISMLSAGPVQAQERSISLFSEIPSSEPYEAYLNTLRGALKEAGFSIEDEEAPFRVGRGTVFDIVASSEGTIGFAFLQEKVEEGDTSAALLTVPAAFSNFEGARQAQQGFIGDLARSEITQDGALAVGLWTHGMNAILTQSTLATLSDLEGMKIQSNDQVSQAFFARLGAAPVAVPFAEVFTGLQVGAFETTLWPQDQIRDDILSAVAGGTILTDHSSRVAVTIVGDAWWSTLGAGEQRRFLSALEEAEEAAAGVVTGQLEELNELLGEFEITATSWSELSEETLDAAVVATAEEASLADGAAIKQLYEDALSLLQENTFVVPEEELENDFIQQTTRIFFATDRRYDSEFDPLVDKFANASGPTGVWRCGELAPAGPSDLGKISEEVELVDGGTITTADACFVEIASAASESGNRVLIYVHGFRNDFRDATRRGLAFSRDLGLTSPLVVWSWPSAGRLHNYPRDSDAVDWSELQFGRFVQGLASHPEITGVDIMAHSMGTRLAANLMRDDWPSGPAAVVLAAADIARPNLKQAADEADEARITLLVSRADVALFGSEFLGARDPRAGRAQPLFVYPGIDTIDLSAFDRLAINHGHSFTVSEVINDLARLFGGEWRATDRGLERRRNAGATVDHYLIRRESN